jgi:DNA recombination protein Rad52
MFNVKQTRALKARLKQRHVRSRVENGATLHYLEGWHVIAEANRIFGFDGWDRETVESTCVYTKRNGERYEAVYTARVRIRVAADGHTIIREGTGCGEADTSSPGEAHDHALKAAETDATKRALMTFGNAVRPVALCRQRRRQAPRPAKPVQLLPRQAADGLRRSWRIRSPPATSLPGRNIPKQSQLRIPRPNSDPRAMAPPARSASTSRR